MPAAKTESRGPAVTRLKITSPGVLLILAILSAGGIFLLDLFYLNPHLSGLEQAALREQAARAEYAGRLVLRAERSALIRTCAALAHDKALRQRIEQHRPDEGESAPPASLGSGAEIDLAWLSDDTGAVTWVWSAHHEEQSPSARGALVEDARAVMAQVAGLERPPEAGMCLVREAPALFARRSAATDVGPGQLWIVRLVDHRMQGSVGAAAGGEVVFVRAETLPQDGSGDEAAAQASWRSDGDNLVVAWVATDPAGKVMGYFRARLPAGHVHLQSVSARRMILIVLSLSVGLVLLVILGTHMLITGPIFRLLKRLQKLESGEGEQTDLSRNLHGEPLVLARRLESAFDKLAQMSKTDQLTGLANRRHFEEVLDCFYHQSRRYNRPLSLFVLDVDFFKAVNDTGGHQAGDELLKVVAAAINKACRRADLPARLGGDEFAVLLPETGADAAATVAQRVRDNLAEGTTRVGSLELNVTVSIGIVDLNAGEIDSPDAMISLADRALYTAKELGRNRIVQAHDLNGVGWSEGDQGAGDVNVLCKKLAGLDSEFKDLFLRAVEEIMELLEERAPHMADHARKVEYFAVLIAREMELPDRVIKRIQIAAMLHDIGMVAMPDNILLNPGSLDERQLQVVRKHPLISVRIMEGMEFLEQEIPAVRYHHERYDGKGYPEGIAGGAIPLTARILAVADSLDAMTSSRTFRKAKTRTEAVEEIRRLAGSQFDPAVVDAFLAVAARLGDDLIHVPGVAAPTKAPAPEQAPATAPQPS